MMHDRSETNQELIEENACLKQRVRELEKLESDLKQDMESMRVREEEYRILANNIPDIIYSLDGEGKVVSVNSKAFERYGYGEQNIQGKPFLDFIHLEDREIVIGSFQKAMEERQEVITGLQFRIVSEEGASYWFELNSRARRDSHGGYIGEDGVLRDITERKQAEDALRESKAFFLNAFNNSPLLMTISDPSTGAYLEVNNSFCRISEFSREESIGKTSVELGWLGVEDRSRLVNELEQQGKVTGLERTLRTKTGKTIICRYSGDIIQTPEGGRLFSVAENITEQKRTEEEKHRSQETAERLAAEMAVISEIGRLIGSTLNIDEVYERFAEKAKKLITFDRVSVNLVNPDGKSFTNAYVYGFDIPHRKPGTIVPIAGSVSELLMQVRSGRVINVEGPEDFLKQFPSAAVSMVIRAGIRSMIGVPLISRGEVIGNLHFRSTKPNAYTEQDLGLAERIGEQIAGAIANAQLYSNLRQAEISLRKSEDRYRTLFNEARDGIALADLETGELLDCNQALCHMVERTKDELVGQAQSILHPRQALVDGYSLSYRMHQSENPGSVMEDTLLSKRGKQIPVAISAAQVSIGGRDCLFGIFHNVTERKRAEEALKETLDQLESRVRERTIELEETNTALRVLLKKGDQDQKRLEESLQSNVNQLVTPFLTKLRVSRSNQERATYLNILEENLNNIVSPFINQLSATYKTLTPKEIQIAELVKQGKRSKEIAELFSISVGTVITHRNKIRRKLDLKSKDANLRSHLLSLA